MAKNTHTTIFEYDVKGIGKVKEAFRTLSELIPDKELSTAFKSIEKEYVSFLRGISSGFSFDFLKGDDLIKNISSVMEKLQKGMSTTIKSPVLESLKSELAELELKIAEGKRKANEAAAKLKKAEEDLKKDLSSGRFNEVKLDPSLTTAAKVEAREKQLRKEASKDTTTSNRKKEIEEEIKALEELLPELKKYVKLRRSLGGTLGGANKGIAINEEKQAEVNKKLAEEQAKLAQATTETSNATAEEKDRIEKLSEAMGFLSKIMEQLSFDKKTAAQKKATKATEDQAKADAELVEEEKKLNEVMDKGEKSMAKKLATGLSYYTVFNQIKKIIKSSINSIKELDKAMTKAAIVTSMTRKETWSLLKSYQNLASETGRTTSEIANLNAFFLQQGKNMKQAMEMTEAAAKSAAVAGTTLQDAANYITSAIHGFGLAASAAESVADKFAALGASSASSFEEIAIAMSKVAPVAQSAGVGIDFMMGILAKGIHTTREAPEAIGTAMKTIFARMRELTDIGKATEDGMSLNRVEKAVNSIGVSLRDTTGQFRNLEDVLIDVGMKWKDLNSLEQAYLATALAGTRQQPRLLAILNDFDTTMEMIETSKNAENELMFQHMDYLDSMEAATNQLKNSWEQIVTTIVNADVIIAVVQTAADALKGISNIVGFIVDRSYLMIPILATLSVLTVNLTKHKLAQWRAALKLNTEENKGFLAKIANDTKEIYTQKLIIAQKKVKQKVMMTERAQIYDLIAAGKAKTMSDAADIIVSKGQTAANYAKAASLWAVLSPMLLVTAAVAAGALAIYGTIKLFKMATKSVKDYGKEIDNSNKKIYDSSKKTKDLKKLTDEYEQLEKQTHKTNEELERMEEILEDLSHFQDGDKEIKFTTSSRDGIDYEKIREFEKKQRDLQAKERVKQLEKAGSAIRKFGTEAFDNSSVRNVFRDMGSVFANQALIDLDRETASRTSSSMKSHLKDYDFTKNFDLENRYSEEKEIIRGIGHAWASGVAGSAAGAGVGTGVGALAGGVGALPGAFIGSIIGGIAGLGAGIAGAFASSKKRKEAEKERIKEQKRLLKEDIQGIAKTYAGAHELMRGHEEESLSSQIDKYTKALDKVKESGDHFGEIFSKSYPSLNKLYNIGENLGLSSSQLEKSISDLEKRGISLDSFLEFSEKFGIGMDLNKAEDSIQEYIDNQSELTNIQFELSAQAELDLSKEEIEELEKREGELLDYFEGRGKELGVYNLKDLSVARYFQTKTGAESFDKLVEGSFSSKDITKMIKEIAEELEKVEGVSKEEAYKYAASQVETFLVPFDSVVAKVSNVREIVEKAFNLEEELEKGNFQVFTDLAAELGDEGGRILEEFLETKDVTLIQNALMKDGKKHLRDQIAAIKASVPLNEELSDIQKDQIANIEFLLQKYDDLDFAQLAWNKRLEETGKLVDRINATLALTERLSDLELNVPEYFKIFIDQSRKVALDEAEKDLEFALKEAKRSQAGDYDDYVQKLENFEEASNIYLDILEKQIDQEKKLREKEIKQIEDSHKDRMDLLKKQHDNKWKEINYENKLIDLQEKVTAARNRLMAAMYGGDKAGQLDATKALKEARQARQKEIEDQILSRIQEEEEKRRNERVEEIQEDIKEFTKTSSETLEKILQRFDKTLSVEVTNSGGGGSISGHSIPSVFYDLKLGGKY